MSETAPPRPLMWNIPAAVAAWVFPGLGHAMSGELKRGAILAAVIGSMWIVGLWVGGISVIEARTTTGQVRPWFLGQMLIAPSLVVEYTHDRYRAQTGGQEPEPSRDPSHPTLYEPSYGRPHEIGTLYTALAGLLNLLAVVDVIYRDPGRAAEVALAARARNTDDAGPPHAGGTT